MLTVESLTDVDIALAPALVAYPVEVEVKEVPWMKASDSAMCFMLRAYDTWEIEYQATRRNYANTSW